MDKPTPPRSDDGLPSEDILRRIRVPLMRRATLKVDDHPEEVFVIDLALDGVFVERSSPLPVGAQVALSFPLPENAIPIVAACRVAWWQSGDPAALPKSMPAGAGLTFVSLVAGDEAKIRRYLTEYYLREPRSRRFVSHASARRNEGGS